MGTPTTSMDTTPFCDCRSRALFLDQKTPQLETNGRGLRRQTAAGLQLHALLLALLRLKRTSATSGHHRLSGASRVPQDPSDPGEADSRPQKSL